MNKIITAQNAPAAVGPYSHAVLSGNTVYTSGQLGADPKTGELGSGVEEQAKLAFQNLIAVLAEAGMSLSDETKTTVFLADMGDFAAVNKIYADFFGGHAPARSCVQAVLPKGALCEVEVIVEL